MYIGHYQLIIIILWTLFLDSESKLSNYPIECHEACSIDYCLNYISFNKNCTKLIRDPCDCCTVCLRKENDICGGRFNVYGVCEDDFVCHITNKIERKGICVKGCLKYQCLSIVNNNNNKTTCQCANRRVPCDKNLDVNTKDTCEKTSDVNQLIDCSNVSCPVCPSDSHFVEDHTLPKNRCCESQGRCVCSTCPKTICGENSIIQIYRTGNSNLPGQCCDQFHCTKNSKQCHHEKKIYLENETWALDHCTTCTCRSGSPDCVRMQCPIDTHCGYMYKPENECCPKCGGCLNDRFHIQHMNSTWIESNGCMRCWCENGRSRCIAEGCIAPPCENPRQIANVCCPVCDDNTLEDDDEDTKISHEIQSIISHQCPPLNNCLLVCEHGLTKDENGCYQCACSTMSCPSPLCTLKFDKLSKQYCLCLQPSGTNCGQLQCDKHCPYDYSIDKKTGCPTCACNPCPQLICTKNCTYGLKRNEVGCSICVCESNLISSNELILHTWDRQCQSGSSSYSNGEIWFDGCRQCFCHKGEQLCALISCPIPKCSQPILLPNRCCPSCPDTPLLPEPIPSSQVCYASQYVTGEELEFDKCTKCICLHNIAFCSISLCPPLSCSIPIYDSLLCCPICPPPTSSSSESTAMIDLSNTNEDDVCFLDDGMIKHAGELWKNNDCQSCLCPRNGNGQIECYSQICNQELSCSNPVLKKGQCCPFCLPPTAAVAICIFNHIQYRSGEHWNVSECHHCECSLGTIVCHQHKCPILTCTHTVTVAGHCCPVCRDLFIQDKAPIPSPRFGFSIIILFSILILILVLVILILLFFLLRGGHPSLSTSNQISNHSPIASHRQPIPYGYNLMFLSNDRTSNPPLNHLPRTSTHSNIGTNSSNNELEPITYDEDDTLILQCSTSSNDDDYQHELNSTDNEESHQQHLSHSKYQMITPPPTIIYV